jgi:hypothetical protein
MSTRTKPAPLLIFLLTFASSRILAQGCTSHDSTGQATGPYIFLNVSNVPSTYGDAVGNAVAAWNASTCNANSSAFPSFVFGAQPDDGSRLVNVVWDSGTGSGECGHFLGNTITLYANATAKNDPNLVIPCGPVFTENLEHELGHSLGLHDSSCAGYIMAGVNRDANGNYNSRCIQPDECSAVNQQWMTPAERNSPPPDPPPGGGGGTGGGDGDGTNNEDLPCFPYIDCSPIILHRDAGPYRLTGIRDAVRFDIVGNGHPLRMGWTEEGSSDAFLWIDRNGDGTVTDGRELFGNTTFLRNGSRAANGFDALSEYDDNGDGIIDENDGVWQRLMLWTDRNHDAITQPEEIESIAGSDVEALSLTYHASGRHDQNGNTFRYQSLIWLRQGRAGRRAQTVYDVFFVTMP